MSPLPSRRVAFREEDDDEEELLLLLVVVVVVGTFRHDDWGANIG
jgi:hypothetical protein